MGPGEIEATPRHSGEALVGRTLGEFAIVEKIGEGGFGAVYLAEQKLLGREAVIKVLHRALQDSSTQRFLREARLASQLDHPFAAHVYAFGAESDGLLWIAMERVRGTPLNELLKSQGPLPLHRFIPFFDKLCEVVQTAHAQGIIHRDLKPANVMVLSRAGKLLPKLLDLGIAKVLEAPPSADSILAPVPSSDSEAHSSAPEASTTRTLALNVEEDVSSTRTKLALDHAFSMHLTQAQGVMGSPHFMAPEQWVNPAGADARTDIYALAVLAFQCLAGELPFKGTSSREIATAHAKNAFPKLPEQFPPELDAVLAKAAAKRPAERFASALELAGALRAASKLTQEESIVPQLPQELRELFISDAPQPIAEAMGLLEAAHHPARAIAAAHDLLRVLIRYICTVALAARARVGPGGESDLPATLALMERLHDNRLDDLGAWDLARSLLQPFHDRREAHPIPELVSLFFDEGSAEITTDRQLRELWSTLSEAKTTPVEFQELGQLLGDLGRLLQRFFFLHEYALRLRRGATSEQWMGLRRHARPITTLASGGPEDGAFFLASTEGLSVLTLSPLMQSIAPTPGAAPEPFFLEGTGRHGAKLLALPVGFERQDEKLWPWFFQHIAKLGEDDEKREAQEVPYLGLASFTSSQAQNFFGREREAEAFANRLRIQSLLGVVGPSGAGKSSFLQAGVLPLLTDWESVTVRPGPSPFTALASKLFQERLLPEVLDVQAARQALLDDPRQLGRWLNAAAKDRGHTLMLVVDQFEELVTLCPDGQERHRFAGMLVEAVAGVEEPVRVVLAFRDDFLIRIQQLPAFRERLSAGLQLLGTPAPDDLLRIVTKPAERMGYRFEDDELPRQMVKEVESLPGALALLSFTASKLWELRDRQFQRLTRKAYAALGGVGGALAHHAESTLSAIPETEKPLVREVFRHLVTAEGTRAVLSRQELDQLLGGPAISQPLLERLIVARLLVTSEAGAAEDRVEVIHEALLGSWPRLVQWQREDAETVRMRDALRAAARQWAERGRPPGLLWRKEPLLEYKVWRSRYSGAVTELEAAFAAASLRDEARGRNLRRGLMTGAVVVLLVVIAVIARAQRQASKSADQAKARLAQLWEEQGRVASLDGKPLESLAYLDAARREGVSGPEINFLTARAQPMAEAARLSFVAHNGFAVANFSPDQQLLATAGLDHLVRLWRASDGAPIAELSGNEKGVVAVGFSLDGEKVISAGQDGAIRLWSTADHHFLGALRSGPQDFIDSFDLSSNGRFIAFAPNVSAISVWDLSTQTLVRQLPVPGHVGEARFSPDGKLLVAALGQAWGSNDDSGAIPIWNAASGRWEREILKGHHGAVKRLAFSPDGRLLASASADGTVRLWDPVKRREVAVLTGHSDVVMAVAFSPDGKLLASSGTDGSVRIWDVAQRKPLFNLAGHTESVPHLRFTPDSARLITASDDRTVRMWDAKTGAFLWLFSGHTQALQSLAMSKDGKTAMSAGAEGLVKVWNLDQQRFVALSTDAQKGLTFWPSEDGRVAVSLRADGNSVDRWDLRSRALIGNLPLAKHTEGLEWRSRKDRLVAYPDGNTTVFQLPEMKVLFELKNPVPQAPADVFCSLSDDGERVAVAHAILPYVELWDVSRKVRLASLVTDGRPTDFLRFIGDSLVVGTIDAAVSSWRASDGLREWTVKPSRVNTVRSVAVSPDHRFVAVGMLDRVSVVWELATGKELATLQGRYAVALDLSFSPDASILAAAGSAGFISVWETQSWRRVGDFAAGSTMVRGTFTHLGEYLAMSYGGPLTRWDFTAPELQPDALHALAQCKTPYRIVGEQLVVDLKPGPGCGMTPVETLR